MYKDFILQSQIKEEERKKRKAREKEKG